MEKEDLINNFGKYGCENGSVFLSMMAQTIGCSLRKKWLEQVRPTWPLKFFLDAKPLSFFHL